MFSFFFIDDTCKFFVPTPESSIKRSNSVWMVTSSSCRPTSNRSTSFNCFVCLPPTSFYELPQTIFYLSHSQSNVCHYDYYNPLTIQYKLTNFAQKKSFFSPNHFFCLTHSPQICLLLPFIIIAIHWLNQFLFNKFPTLPFLVLTEWPDQQASFRSGHFRSWPQIDQANIAWHSLCKSSPIPLHMIHVRFTTHHLVYFDSV